VLVMQPPVNADELTQVRNRRIRGYPEKIQTNAEQDHVNQTRNQDPLPQPVFTNENMCLPVGLYGNDNFLEQTSFLRRSI
jgi:hypothetical protein